MFRQHAPYGRQNYLDDCLHLNRIFSPELWYPYNLSFMCREVNWEGIWNYFNMFNMFNIRACRNYRMGIFECNASVLRLFSRFVIRKLLISYVNMLWTSLNSILIKYTQNTARSIPGKCILSVFCTLMHDSTISPWHRSGFEKTEARSSPISTRNLGVCFLAVVLQELYRFTLELCRW